MSLSVATEGTTVTKDKSDKMATRWRQDDKMATNPSESQHVTAVSHSPTAPRNQRNLCPLLCYTAHFPKPATICQSPSRLQDGGRLGRLLTATPSVFRKSVKCIENCIETTSDQCLSSLAFNTLEYFGMLCKVKQHQISGSAR